MKKETIVILAAGAVVGVLAIILMLLGNPANMGFCIACFERDFAGAIGLHHPWAAAWMRPEIIGIVLGAFLASLMFREFRPEGGSSPMARFLLAMFVMIGALAFLGCPLRMTLRLAAGDLNALVALFGFIAGIWAGVFLLRAGFNLGRTQKEKTVSGLILPAVMTGMLVCAFVFPFFRESAGRFLGKGGHIGTGKAPVMTELVGIFISLAAGLIVGFLAQRSRMCFAGGIRDVILIRSFHLVKGFAAVFALALIGSLVFGKFQFGFEKQPIAHTNHVWNFLGLALVGLASTLLGGCPLRQLVLSGSGNSDSSVTVLGMFTGAAIVHNFGLAKGATIYGQAAVVIGIIVIVLIGLFSREKL
jgi:YedE family putative selenium metabolism protein